MFRGEGFFSSQAGRPLHSFSSRSYVFTSSRIILSIPVRWPDVLSFKVWLILSAEPLYTPPLLSFPSLTAWKGGEANVEVDIVILYLLAMSCKAAWMLPKSFSPCLTVSASASPACSLSASREARPAALRGKGKMMSDSWEALIPATLGYSLH